MREDPVSIKYWDDLLADFPEYQYVLFNEAMEPIACGHAIPCYWDGIENNLPSGWDDVFEKGMIGLQNKVLPNTLSALAIVIHPNYRGQGLSKVMIRQMKDLVIENNFDYMVAPIRPSLKNMYPIIPMNDYMMWKRKDGLPFDPWIRTHVTMGATIIKMAEKSMVISASIKEWESWTNMKMPASGKYIIPEGLVPLEVDLSRDRGVYIEPNVWIKHDLE